MAVVKSEVKVKWHRFGQSLWIWAYRGRKQVFSATINENNDISLHVPVELFSKVKVVKTAPGL